jgi:ParB-like chromosome segregation protein Spo0J
MLKTKSVPIESIYVPLQRRDTLDPEKVQKLAAEILQNGQELPVMVREDGARLILVEGLHRLEACRALGETTIMTYLVQARRH